MMRGLETAEAATLTAYLAGIPLGQRWSLSEVSRLLFLRELARRGHWTIPVVAVEENPARSA